MSYSPLPANLHAGFPNVQTARLSNYAMAHFELSKTPPQIRQMFSLWRASPNEVGAKSQRWRAVAAASLGNALEWFDFVIYGYFAATIAKLFFPSNSDLESLLIALATFGITFFIRPLGAILLGAFAD